MASTTRATSANVQISGILDMRENEITNLETDLSLYPVTDDQGATKIYVDNARDTILAALATTVDNEEY